MKRSLKESDALELKVADVSDAAYIKYIAYNTWYDAYGNILSEAQIVYMLAERYNETVLMDVIGNTNEEFLILFVNELPKAFASYIPSNDEVLKLCKIYVLPEAQGFGFGDKLMNSVKMKAFAEGYSFIELNVNRANSALKYYEKRGFQVVEEVDISIGNYWMNDYVMQCPV